MAQKQLMVVLSNAKPGREKEFNDWYTNQHVPDVLKVPGVASAQRYELSKSQRGDTPSQWQYLAVYNLQTDDLPGTLAEIGRRARTPQMPVSDAVKDTWAYIYEPITEEVKRTG
jgi:hypothetical protein